jgi:hypothetical protein
MEANAGQGNNPADAPAFHACPGSRSFAPSRCFGTQAEAERFAEEQARRLHVGYAVYRRLRGRLKLLRVIAAGPLIA